MIIGNQQEYTEGMDIAKNKYSLKSQSSYDFRQKGYYEDSINEGDFSEHGPLIKTTYPETRGNYREEIKYIEVFLLKDNRILTKKDS